MARDESNLGDAPETAGRKKMALWVQKKGNTLTALAEFVGVKPPSAHAWLWCDGRPNEKYRPLLCELVGGKPEDWDTPEERRERRARDDRRKALRGAAA